MSEPNANPTPAPAGGTPPAEPKPAAAAPEPKPAATPDPIIGGEPPKPTAVPTSILDPEPAPEPKPGEPEPKPKEPITYKDFTIPEGVELIPESMEGFKKLASDAGLPQEQAQSLLNMHVEAIQSVVKQMEDGFNGAQEEWQKAVKADKEIGGNNLAQVRATVSKALDQFGTPGVREALKLTGAGNHPEVVRTFYRMAKALTEGGIIRADAPARVTPKTAADILYGTPQLEKAS